VNTAPLALPRAGSDKIVFANQLRGVAALCVVLVHYTVVYQLMRPVVAWVIAAPPIAVPVPALSAWIYPWWFDSGAFGVALFFLISGFVIPFSLDKNSRLTFLLARGLRIFPTYWLALLIEWGTIYGFSRYWGKPIAFDRQTFLYNILLIHTSIGALGVDLVNWTLTIEIKFYLLMAVLRPLIVRKVVWPLLLYPIGALALNILQARGVIHLPVLLISESMYVVFMLPGTLFHYHFCRALSTRRLVLGCGAILAMAAACWKFGPLADQFPLKTLNYFYGFGVFAMSYAARGWFRRAWLLDFFADISFPLYLVHSLVGYSVMSYLILARRVPYAIAAPAAFGVAVLIAWILHISIERASIAAGRRLAAARAPDALLGLGIQQARSP
jgi:peptidoglycan/LPS O-acetylase OafA/YrhL